MLDQPRKPKTPIVKDLDEDKIDWGGGWIQTRSLSKGRFLVLGFAGAAGPDHAAHLREIAKLWKRFREL